MKRRRSAAKVRVRSRKLACFATAKLNSALREPSFNTPEANRLIEQSKMWWDRFASVGDWQSGIKVSRLSAEKFPKLYFGWENWAWALHKSGKTEAAYKLLAPIMKGLRLPGPPSGRGAYCLACFCCSLGRTEEAARWLRLALIQAQDKAGFKLHAFKEMELEPLWPMLADTAGAVT